jgi:hypothetical protein
MRAYQSDPLISFGRNFGEEVRAGQEAEYAPERSRLEDASKILQVAKHLIGLFGPRPVLNLTTFGVDQKAFTVIADDSDIGNSAQ